MPSIFSTAKEFEAFMDRACDHVMQCLLEALAELIREADERARSRGWDESFHDVTGNLRSSIGGAVVCNGRKFFQTNFEQVLNGSEGSSKGKSMTDSLAGQYTDAVAAFMVAAMPYADYVEAMDSKDVIESTRIWAESEVGRRLTAALEKAARDINSW